MAAVFAFGIFGLIWLGVMVGLIILSGFGLYRMAQHAGAPSPWMAFVPVASSYLTGLLAERAYYTYNGRTRKLAWWCVIANVIPLGLFAVFAAFFFRTVIAAGGALAPEEVAGMTPLMYLLNLVALLPAILYGYCLYYIFRDYSPDNAVLFAIVGVLFRISFVFLLIERNTVPVSVTGFGAYPYGRPKYDRWHRWNQTPPQQYGPGSWPPQGGGPGTTGPGDYYQNR